jgi:membrane protease YdiL (CAAX protease family)
MTTQYALTPEAPARPRNAGTLVLFLVLLIGASAVLDWMMIRAGGLREAGGLVALIMCVPALSAIAALLVTRRSLRGIGWRLGPISLLAAAIALPVLIATPAYLALWGVGLAQFDLHEWSELVTENFGWALSPLPSVLVIASLGLLLDALVAAGEEIGWRGLLFPELAKRMSLPLAALLTGAIWTVWHFPGIIYGGYSNDATPLWFNLTCFTAMALGWSMVLAWLRSASGSVWPAVLMHGAHNILIQAILDPITHGTNNAAPFITGEFGAGVALAYVLAGVIAWNALSKRSAVSS